MTELNEQNYKRISIINWILASPLILVFAWPYNFTGVILDIHVVIRYAGSLLFATPFMVTLLHGHVTIALGLLHRNHYYNWLEQHPYTYGLFFHRVLIRTRFRLLLLLLSFILLGAGWIYF